MNPILALRFTIVLLMFTISNLVWSQGCNLSNYSTATRIGPSMFPYVSGQGVTVTATVFNVPTYTNFTYTCGTNSFACSDPAWWHQYASGWIRLNFSVPITKMTWVLNGSNTSEVFTFVPNTGTVSLTDFCSGGGNFSAAGNQLTCNGSLGTIVSVIHPTGMTQLTVYHNGVGAGSRMTPLDCFILATPLPASITSFDGHDEGKVNRLTWVTESEINNENFIIEKSIDAINYEEFSIVDGAGNSNTTLSYSTIDDRPGATTYYKLKQVDFNGDYVYYGPVVITNNQISNYEVFPVYPNPADEFFYLDIFSEEPSDAKISIYDAVGKLLLFTEKRIEGRVKIPVHSLGWASGIYSISVINSTNGIQYTQRIAIN